MRSGAALELALEDDQFAVDPPAVFEVCGNPGTGAVRCFLQMNLRSVTDPLIEDGGEIKGFVVWNRPLVCDSIDAILEFEYLVCIRCGVVSDELAVCLNA